MFLILLGLFIGTIFATVRSKLRKQANTGWRVLGYAAFGVIVGAVLAGAVGCTQPKTWVETDHVDLAQFPTNEGNNVFIIVDTVYGVKKYEFLGKDEVTKAAIPQSFDYDSVVGYVEEAEVSTPRFATLELAINPNPGFAPWILPISLARKQIFIIPKGGIKHK